jgi:hypothetical protein
MKTYTIDHGRPGMASRYGSMKQIQAFGPSGETIMDYSIFDAIEAELWKSMVLSYAEILQGFSKHFRAQAQRKNSNEYVYQETGAFLGEIQCQKNNKAWVHLNSNSCASNL